MGWSIRFSIQILAVALLTGLPGGAQSDSPAHIFRPTPNAIVEPGPLNVVARGSSSAVMLVDGNALEMERPGPLALAATISPSAGLHELLLRDGDVEERVAFFAGDPSAAAQLGEEWKPFRAHPPPALGAPCTTCHEVRDGKWDFVGGSIASNCFQCHDEGGFAKVHTHERGVLYSCAMCHMPHGSTEAKHLKMSVESACTQCHF